MESVVRLSSAERRELFAETAVRKGMTPAIVEKDFWVCWTLGRLFAHPDLSRLLMFKGGTSLSKVFHLIERFSEDIDLILDWRVVVGEDDPLAERSRSFSSRRTAQCRPYAPSARFGRRRRYCTTKPIARKAARSRCAIRVTTTIWP